MFEEKYQKIKVTNNNDQINDVSIHYVWIGPPCEDNKKKQDSHIMAGSRVVGHDTLAPIKMSQLCQGDDRIPVYFWMLPDYKDYYQKKFKQYSNLTVKCIYLDIKQLKQELLPFLENNNDDDFLSYFNHLKELMKLFLGVSFKGWKPTTNNYLPFFPSQIHPANTRSCTVIKEMFVNFLLAFCFNIIVLDSNVFPNPGKSRATSLKIS